MAGATYHFSLRLMENRPSVDRAIDFLVPNGIMND
jgi:hypothetical protein